MADSCYIHIPFCRALCRYCDFYRVRYNPAFEEAFLEALTREISLRQAGRDRSCLKTLYFGGGTPTVLSDEFWREIFRVLKQHFDFGEDTEVTVEANPESATESRLSCLREFGADRVSLGAQSFDPDGLSILGRIHDPAQTRLAVKTARAVGFENLSLDLIYGLPEQTTALVLADLRAALELHPEHLSLYALTLEGGVPLQQAVEAGRLSLPPDDVAAEAYLEAVQLLADHGYLQYEISNFALPGRECRHNLNYWHQRDYLGFGPAAVSTVGDKRIKNQPNLESYITSLQSGKLPPQEVETLDAGTRLREAVFLSLRLSSGLDLTRLKREHDYDLFEERHGLLIDLQRQGDVVIGDQMLRLTARGMLRSDLIMTALLP